MDYVDTENIISPDAYDSAVLNGTIGKVTGNPGLRAKKIPLKFDIETLDLLAAYAYEESSQYITRAALSNLKTLIDMCNMSLYKNNQSLKARIDFIKLILEAKLTNGLDSRKLLVGYVMERAEYKELIRNEILPEITKLKLNNRAIQHLNGFITDRLIYGFMYSYKNEIFQIYEDMESGNFSSLKDLSNKYRLIISDLLHDIRISETVNDKYMTLDLSEGNFENVVTQMVTKLRAPGNKLRTGSQGLNELLNGGFEAGRSYIFYGLPGIGKSVVLLNITEWIRKFNKIKLKDGAKRRAVVYITQENSMAETIERLFNMTVCGDDIRNYTPSEVVKLLRTTGQLTLSGSDDIDLIIKYYDDKEISTLDLYNIIDDIEDTGKEVIALVHDYLERIRSSINHPEPRFEYAAVANDYSVLAKRLNIPIIGAGQINRKGSDTIDSGAEANKADLIRLLGKGVVSESWGVLKNIDAAYLIHREFDSDFNEYITFLNLKFRGRKGKKKKFETYLAHPLDPDNGIKLMDDLDKDMPLSRTTLSDSAKDLEILKRNQSIKEKQNLSSISKTNKSTKTEEIDNNTIMDFKFLGEALKRRNQIERTASKISDNDVDKNFDDVFTKYMNFDDSYKRNSRGYIEIQRTKKSMHVKILPKQYVG